ncbi:MAG: tRNA (adenosine(37)-N6)-dimethylallyltransferase MiaA [Xenococcus sp. (in: cyanobacteria)]
MLIVICGATASGKSGLALKLAQRLNTVIISADSRQVYREFDIGTAKPSVAEQQLVPHYMIDICEPTETLTLAEYQEQTQEIINNLNLPISLSGRKPFGFNTFLKSGNPPTESVSPCAPTAPPTPPAPLAPEASPASQLLVGGTGLYIQSITQGLKIPRVAPHSKLRSQLTSLGQTQLYSFLSQVDPIASSKIHPNDQVRTLRALEVYYATGKTITIQQGKNPPEYPILQIGLDCDVEMLDRRIAQRTYQMIELGLVDEVTKLCDKYGLDLPLLNTLGYAEIKQYLAGDINLESAIADTILHTRQFAKRQRTWFRKIQDINWFDANDPDLLENVWQKISSSAKLNSQ